MSQPTVVINIGAEFGRFPLGRLRKHGAGSGEEFREEFLIPALRKNPSRVVIQLDDALGYGSSFLDEAFGGLVRAGYDKDLLLKTFEFVSEDLSLIDDIKKYIQESPANGTLD